MITRIVVIFFCTFASVNTHAVNKRQTSASSFSSLQPVINTQEDTIINGIEELALDISGSQWEQGHTGNVVQSPVSIAALLSLLLLASRGETHSELKTALHYPNDLTDTLIHQTFKKVLESIESVNHGVSVSTDSRLFLQEGLSVLGQFTEMAEDSYGSKVRGLNFAGAPTIAMNMINQWVERSTSGKITDLIRTPFTPNTKFVAANVIYFNGEWEYPFSKRLTENRIFSTGTKNITVPMMINLMTVPFLRGDKIGFDMIALPYKGGKYSMYILTPTGKPGIQSIQSLEYHLDSQVLKDLIGRMRNQRVSVKLPRMKLSQKMYLKNDLQNLGVTTMFKENKADFGRLTTQSGIFIDNIVHEAIIEITETGTVAAAASAATFDRIGGNEDFRLDRPSLLFIRDNNNGLVLFWARVMEPEPIFN